MRSKDRYQSNISGSPHLLPELIPISLVKLSLSRFNATSRPVSTNPPFRLCRVLLSSVFPAALFLRCSLPPRDPPARPPPHTTVQASTVSPSGIRQDVQILACLPTFTSLLINADASIAEAEYRWAPAETVARGPMLTEFSIMVVIRSGAADSMLEPKSRGVPGVDGVEGVDRPELLVTGPPITDFSPIMHPSPMLTGPLKESSFARGWITVPAPTEIGWTP